MAQHSTDGARRISINLSFDNCVSSTFNLNEEKQYRVNIAACLTMPLPALVLQVPNGVFILNAVVPELL